MEKFNRTVIKLLKFKLSHELRAKITINTVLLTVTKGIFDKFCQNEI